MKINVLTGIEPCRERLLVLLNRHLGPDDIIILDRETDPITVSSLNPGVTMTQPRAIAYDKEQGLVFFTDNVVDKIWSKDINSDDNAVLIRDLTGSGNDEPCQHNKVGPASAKIDRTYPIVC